MKKTRKERAVLMVLLELEEQGLVERVGSSDARKAKWKKTPLGEAVLAAIEGEKEKQESLNALHVTARIL